MPIVVEGGLFGALVGVVLGFGAAVIQLSARRLRNAILLSRGEPAYKDAILIPFWKVSGPVGLLAGAVLGGLGMSRVTIVLGASALPVLLALSSVLILLQARRRGP